MPCRRASSGRVEVHGFAVEQNFALVRDQRAGQDLDQRGLAGAVVADHGQDLAGQQLEIGAVQGRDVAEALDQAACLEHRCTWWLASLGAGLIAHPWPLCESWSTDTERMTRMPVISTW